MGAWMCPKCGHGRFTYPYRNLTIMCDREGCGYVERRDSMTGTKVRKEHRKKLRAEGGESHAIDTLR